MIIAASTAPVYRIVYVVRGHPRLRSIRLSWIHGPFTTTSWFEHGKAGTTSKRPGQRPTSLTISALFTVPVRSDGQRWTHPTDVHVQRLTTLTVPDLRPGEPEPIADGMSHHHICSSDPQASWWPGRSVGRQW